MENLPLNKFNNKNVRAKIENPSNQARLKYIWLLASHPKKTFSIRDIVDSIMNSGVMIHEKNFANMMQQKGFRKTGVPMLKTKEREYFRYKNKFMDNDFDFF